MTIVANQEFGLLVAVKELPRSGTYDRWQCRCKCGRDVKVAVSMLVSGRTTSCGCVRRGRTKRIAKPLGYSPREKPYVLIWRAMRQRCYNSQTPEFADYGARGIVMSADWRDDFWAFFRDMGERPSTTHTIDRIDTTGIYSKENCRWATKTEQCANRRNTRRVVVDGAVMTLADAARRDSIPYAHARYLANIGKYHQEMERAPVVLTLTGK